MKIVKGKSVACAHQKQRLRFIVDMWVGNQSQTTCKFLMACLWQYGSVLDPMQTLEHISNGSRASNSAKKGHHKPGTKRGNDVSTSGSCLR